MEDAAKTLISNVGQQLAAEYRQLRRVGSQITELRDDMETMNALLRMRAEADDGAVDHFVRVWMKQLRELAYDAEDCIDLYLLRIRSRVGDGVLARSKHLFETLFLRRSLAGEISALRARAVAISERHARFGVDREALRRSPSLPATPMLTASAPVLALRRANDGPAGHHQVIGIENQADKLAKKLKASVEGECYLKVFSVVGFGGVGKTTLALEVCRRLEAEFSCQAMVTVSQAFDPTRDLKPLLKSALQQVLKVKKENERCLKEKKALDGIDGLDEKQLADQLEEVTKNKRYLIVIDDVWTVRSWEAIYHVLPKNKCESRIMVTTRIETVANACSPVAATGNFIHKMEGLKLEDAKKLFLSKAFGSSDSSCPKDLEVMMDSILRKCGTLPLAIVSIASVLAAYRSSESKDKWETIYKSIGYQMESNPTFEGMRQILTLSYNHLPHELKSCMMYLSIFPEKWAVKKDQLLRRWIAEGLIPEKRGLTTLEVAQSFLDELMRRNMISSFRGAFDMIGPAGFHEDGKTELFQVHDMLYEVMVSMSLEANFVSFLGGPYDGGTSYNSIRRLSIHGRGPRPKKKMAGRRQGSSCEIEKIGMQHVRSLSMFQQVEGHKILDLLGSFTLLRVLDLEDCEGVTDKHVSYACKLHLLKFLSLRGTKISMVPPHVNNLEHLQTLDVRGTQLSGLPETVTELEKLECLQFTSRDHWFAMWRLPRGLSKMKALREVSFALLENDDQVAQELGTLEQLQELSIYIVEGIQEKVLKDFAISLGKILLWSLNLGHVGNDSDYLKFLHGLPEPPRLLRHFRITGGVGGRLPTWFGSLTYLIEMVMAYVDLSGDEPYGILCNLPNLRSIKMERHYYTGKELVARGCHKFEALKNLALSTTEGTTPMPQVIVFEEGSMPKLEKLRVNFHQYEKSIVGIKHLTCLKEVQVSGRKDNTALDRALDELKAESRRYADRFQVVVKYV